MAFARYGSVSLGFLTYCSWLGALFGEAANIPRHATVVSRQVANASTYDFVIAGGGIAGLTIADRLTEDPDVAVLVIDAGPLDEGQAGILVPGAYAPYLYFWPDIFTPPQTALNNRSVEVLCAQVVGGGSVINAMVFLRGDKVDYDDWGSLGNSNMSWDDMFPYFLKSENFTAPDSEFAAVANISWDDSVRGTSGPVQYSYPNYFYPASANWWNAALSIGLEPAEDPNNGDNPGIFWIPSVLNATTMTRSDARINHYDRVIGSRPNYHLLASNLVSKVIFEDGQAVGVEYIPTSGGDSAVVYASKEVILAAGAVHTPQILQLSGIGPGAVLSQFGVSIISDLPGVGQNLQDQSTLTIPYNFTNNISPNSGDLITNATYNAEEYLLYNETHSGPYTIVSTLSTNFASLTLQMITAEYENITAQARARDPAESLPEDVDATVLAGYTAQRELILDQFERDDVTVGTMHWGTADSALIYHLKPLSRGTVNINSTSILDSPVVDFRTATDPTDLALYTALVRRNRELFAAPDMAVLGPTEISPFGDDVQTDDEIIAVLRDQINPSNAHMCCTAAMMPQELGGVVDSNWNVYGVKGLRVADISYWPFQTSGAPTATMYASGEKLADVIKATYSLS
ncbi:hypothetical protein BX600DRAFT_111656 [Xylariales sp. PMI_506]|nr:hypothetical protein BX600DRAFT_111656 [Xylariales sp. PMI_506]